MADKNPLDSSRRRLLMAAAGGLAAAPLAQAATSAAGSAKPFLKLDGPRLRVAFGSCAKQSKPQPIWAAITAARPDLFLFMGDNLYADARDAATLRQRYAEFRQVEALQAFRRNTPHLAIWDDHDFGDDDVGGDYELKQLSQQLFCDEWGEKPDSPRRTRSGVYEAYRVESAGRSVQILMLDLRFNRTPLVADPKLQQGYRSMVMQAKLSGKPMIGWYVPNPDPQASLLGEEQWAWLAERLAEPADLRIIGSSVQFAADGTGWECWANFPRERERLVALLAKHRAEHAVIVSGDMHYAELSKWPVAAGYPLWDLTSSGLTEVWDIPTPNSRRVSPVFAEPNFGLLDIDWRGAGSVNFSIVNVEGRERLSQRVALDSLRFAAT
ncbi:MAG TPA: alkaline phosphatase D family protein [Burkholderiaceae bacterium]|jgi:alkaline phosphatase D